MDQKKSQQLQIKKKIFVVCCVGLCRISHSLPPRINCIERNISFAFQVISFCGCNGPQRTRKGDIMFAPQATRLLVGSTWEGAFLHVVMISRSYHTAAHPTNTVVLAIFHCSYSSIRVPELDGFQNFWNFHHSPIDFTEVTHLVFVLEPL